MNDNTEEKINTLADLYSYLDKNALLHNHASDLVNLLRDYIKRASSDEEKQKAQWEIDFFVFHLLGERVFTPVLSFNPETDEVVLYPDTHKFYIDQFDYLKERATNASSPFLLARYNHLLWKSPKGIKNKKYAQIAIQNYFKTLRQYCELLKDEVEDLGYKIGKLYESAVALCGEINSEINELKELTNYLLYNTQSIPFYIKYGIITDMLENPKIFKPIDFENTLQIFESDLVGDLDDHFHLAEMYLSTAIKIARKIKSDVKKWHNKLGCSYLKAAELETNDERAWIKIDIISRAIKEFKLGQNIAKKNEAEKLYADTKPKVKLDTVPIPRDKEITAAYKQVFKDIQNDADQILDKHTASEIYQLLSIGFYFPKAEAIKQMKHDGILTKDIFTTVKFDKNKNVSKQSKEETLTDEMKVAYNFQLFNMTFPFWRKVFTKGIQSGHLAINNFFEFLRDKSWLGKPFYKVDIDGNQYEVGLLGLIMPSISEFFYQVLGSESSKYYLPNYILCSDSLALKIELVLRNLCERLNIPVSVSRSKGMQEMYLNEIFENETLNKFFNEDDKMFFDLVITDKGMNIRNNIAHAFYLSDEYTLEKILLLITVLLRLCKINYKRKT